MIDKAKLRELAEAYRRGERQDEITWMDTVTPAAILSLLDELERAERVCRMIATNRGCSHQSLGLCVECRDEQVHCQPYVCHKCIDKALKQWQEGR